MGHSSSAISRIDSAVLAEAVTLEQPALSKDDTASAAMPKFNLERWRARESVGKALSGSVAGNAIAEGIIYGDYIEKVIHSLQAELESLADHDYSTDPKIKLEEMKIIEVKRMSIVESINRSIDRWNTIKATQLKASEITVAGGSRLATNRRAPKLDAHQTYIETVNFNGDKNERPDRTG